MEAQLKKIIRESIFSESEKCEISPELVASIIFQESFRGTRKFSEAVFAIRYEDGFYARYLANKPFIGVNPNYNKVSRVTERRARAFSYGLMQIMGQTAREYGFAEPYLASLVWPVANISLGCKILQDKLRKHGAIDGIRAYNGSINNPDTEKYRLEVEDHLKTGNYKEVLGDG